MNYFNKPELQFYENKICKYNIKHFSLSELETNYSMFFIIRCEFNKKSFIKFLLANSSYPIIPVVSHQNKKYSYYDITPKKFIYNSYKPTLIPRLIKRDKLMKSNTKLNSKVTLIFDECLNTNCDWCNDLLINSLFTKHKKSNINLVWSTIVCFTLPEYYQHMDWVCLGPTHFLFQLKQYHKLFCNWIELNDFIQLFNYFTKNNLCMVINLKSQSKLVCDKIFYINLN